MNRLAFETYVEQCSSALEAAGVEFIPENGGGAVVRLAKGSGLVDEEERPDEMDAHSGR